MSIQQTITPHEARKDSKNAVRYLLQGLVFLPIVAIFLTYSLWTSDPALSPADGIGTVKTTLSIEALEERFGVQIRLVAVTAAGGMVDFRYKVIDKEKADFLVGLGTDPPSLIIEEADITLSIDDDHIHGDELIDGRLYFHFYPNADNVVKPGTPIVVSFGSIQLEPIATQG